MRSLWHRSKEIWDNNIKAFQFLGVDCIREASIMELRTIKKLWKLKVSKLTFNLLIRTFQYENDQSKMLYLFLKLADSLDQDEILIIYKTDRFSWDSSITSKIISKSDLADLSLILRRDPRREKVCNVEDFYDENSHLWFNEFIKRNTVIFEKNEDNSSIKMYALSHFSLYMIWKQYDGFKSEELEDKEVVQILETKNLLFTDVTIWSCFLEQYIKNVKQSKIATNIKRFHICSHLIKNDLENIRAFINWHDAEHTYNIVYNNKCSYTRGLNYLHSFSCSSYIILDKKGSSITIKDTDLEFEYNYLDGIDIKNSQWLPLSLEYLNWNLVVKRTTHFDDSLSEYIKSWQDLIDEELFPIIFIKKNDIKILRKIDLLKWEFAIF